MAASDIPTLPKGKPLHLLLLGKTGHGKSATGNTLLEKEVFISEAGGESVTRESQVFGNRVAGRQITVVDTPGTMDTRDPDDALLNLASAIIYLNGELDAFVIVLNYSTRMTEEETNCIEKMKILFGPEVVDFIVVVFTHADNFQREKKKKKDQRSFDQFLEEKGGEFLLQFLADCGNRYTLFDNLAEEGEAREQIINIVTIIDLMTEENQGRQYRPFWHSVGQYADNDDVITNLYNEEENNRNLFAEESNESGEQDPPLECEFGDLKNLSVAEDRNDSDAQPKGTDGISPIIMPEDEEERKRLLSEMKETGAECFPAESLVLVSPYGYVKMKDLAIGDKVLTVSPDLSIHQTEVYLFGHSLKQCKATFICLRTKTHQLKVTGGHYIHTFTNGHLITRAAKEVAIGDVLLTSDEGRCVPEKVTDIWPTEEIGLYAPFTLSGTIVVDGVLASCYVDVLPPDVAHSLLWPVRQLYKMSPSTLTAISKTGNDGIPRWIRLCLDNFL